MPESDLRDSKPLRVSVLVDLVHRPDAGGHVKAWEKLAAAATGVAGLDLTIHFAGAAPALRRLADNVRYRLHRPAFSTARLPFLSHVPDHTDLAPHHPGLARHLEDADLIHTTDAYFAFAHTAERVARRRGVALTNSVHTDTPGYTRLFTAQTIERLCGGAPLGRLLSDRFDVPGRMEARMRRRLLAHQRLCAAALVSRREELAPLERALAPRRTGLLRRGIDRELFSQAGRDRGWLRTMFGVPPDRLLVLFVGRVDRGKNVHTLVDAIDTLVRAGRPFHLFCAGEGADRRAVAERLGPAATCPGVLQPADLARVYAAADVVAHPSEIEEASNVVLEALSSGRPLVTSAAVARSALVEGETGLAAGGTAAEWAAVLARLETDAALRARLGSAGRRWAEATVPTWREVLEQDLLPVWQGARAQVAP